jgi:hypothetical protein
MRPVPFIGAAFIAAAISSGACLGAPAAVPTHSRRPSVPAVHIEKAAQQSKPFAFRGIALGITLDEFRAGAMVRATPPGSVPVCETDVAAGALGMELHSDQSVTVACRWAHRTADGWRRSQAVVDGSLAQDHVLRFARTAGQREYRLYEMSFVVDETVARDLREALAQRYGAPHLATDAAADPSRGAAPIYVWSNELSSITLCYLPASHNATLTYLLNDPDAWLKAVARRWLDDSADAV